MDLKKLKNQNGLTGIDVVVALSIISVTTIAILAIYVNVVANSKKATRASAATRIATSILSNIDYMYYAEVERDLYSIRASAGLGDDNLSFVAPVKTSKVFNTKIDTGYEVEIDSTEITSNRPGGTAYEAEGDIAKCPLVLEVKVKVSYEVSGVKESVSLKTIKKRELLDYCNEPDTKWLIGKTINGFKVESLNQIQPIKWSVSADNYVKINESDDWYNYIDGDWAKVAITTDNTAFDPATGAIDRNKIMSGSIPLFMWIPRCGYSSKNGKLIFAHRTSNDAIHEIEMNMGYMKTLIYYGVAAYDKTTKTVGNIEGVNVNNNVFNSKESGVWVRINGSGSGGTGNTLQIGGDETNTKKIIEELNKSEFGPVRNHLGKTYY